MATFQNSWIYTRIYIPIFLRSEVCAVPNKAETRHYDIHLCNGSVKHWACECHDHPVPRFPCRVGVGCLRSVLGQCRSESDVRTH